MDLLTEIYESMSRNKLRIALTGFSIAWGIFMLIVLLGAGNGLLHGITDIFASQAVNNVQLWPGNTTREHNGLPKNREIYLDVNDIAYLQQQFPNEIEEIQPSIESGIQITHEEQHVSTNFTGVYPSYITSSDISVLSGRSINDVDIRECRKVCMLHKKTVEKLFADGEDCVGQWVKFYDLPFMVVGTYKRLQNSRDESPIIPFSTAAVIFKPDQHFSELKLMVKNLDTAEANEAFNDSLRHVLARHKQFADDDRNALWMWNSYENYLQTRTVFKGLSMLIWIIGLATLIAGVAGISNIMLITVRERTHEFGIRKALGAKPRKIVALVIYESIAITLVFGYLGMFFGIGLTQIATLILQQSASVDTGQESFTVFKDPTVDLPIIIMATIVMVIAGVIAGYIPAKKAVDIKPVEALAAM